MKKVYERTTALTERVSGFCPGCMHGLVSKMIAELIEEYELQKKAVCILPVGCGTMSKNITGFKRSAPDRFVFTYQGDGDLGAIGFSEIMHAANRGEKIFTVFINNSTYGMTGGQMAPTTLIGQKTTTTPFGRNPENEGYPMKMCDTPANVLKAKAGLRKAFEINIKNQGFAFVELLCTCPTNWGMSAQKCIEWMKENTMKTFPTGVFKMKDEVK